MSACKPAEKVLKPLLATVLTVSLRLSNEDPRRINGGACLVCLSVMGYTYRKSWCDDFGEASLSC